MPLTWTSTLAFRVRPSPASFEHPADLPRCVWYGERKRVTLKDDLTRYHTHPKPGVQGTLLPEVKANTWGSDDRFGAVKFDCCGHTLDVLLRGLEIEGAAEAAREREARLREELKSTKRAILRRGPRGGFRSLSIEYANADGTPTHVSYGSLAREKAEWILEVLKEHSIPVEEVREPV